MTTASDAVFKNFEAKINQIFSSGKPDSQRKAVLKEISSLFKSVGTFSKSLTSTRENQWIYQSIGAVFGVLQELFSTGRFYNGIGLPYLLKFATDQSIPNGVSDYLNRIESTLVPQEASDLLSPFFTQLFTCIVRHRPSNLLAGHMPESVSKLLTIIPGMQESDKQKVQILLKILSDFPELGMLMMLSSLPISPLTPDNVNLLNNKLSEPNFNPQALEKLIREIGPQLGEEELLFWDDFYQKFSFTLQNLGLSDNSLYRTLQQIPHTASLEPDVPNKITPPLEEPFPRDDAEPPIIPNRFTREAEFVALEVPEVPEVREVPATPDSSNSPASTEKETNSPPETQLESPPQPLNAGKNFDLELPESDLEEELKNITPSILTDSTFPQNARTPSPTHFPPSPIPSIPNKVKHVHWPPETELSSFIPDTHSQEAEAEPDAPLARTEPDPPLSPSIDLIRQTVSKALEEPNPPQKPTAPNIPAWKDALSFAWMVLKDLPTLVSQFIMRKPIDLSRISKALPAIPSEQFSTRHSKKPLLPSSNGEDNISHNILRPHL